MVKFEKEDRSDWRKFRMGKKQHLSSEEFELVCQLHAKYHNHKYHKPCTCNPKKNSSMDKRLEYHLEQWD